LRAFYKGMCAMRSQGAVAVLPRVCQRVHPREGSDVSDPTAGEPSFADHSAQDPIARALGRIPSGLFVVAARRGDEETSFLASWVMQAGFSPPTVSVAVGLTRPARPFMDEEGARFAVSVIGEAERKKLGPFYRAVGPGPRALEGYEVDRTPGGLAVVRGCLAWLECQTTRSVASGDHLIVIAQVLHAAQNFEGGPTVHVRTNGLDY
jgi:flavin reductase (DIM6/NTAB) family NADH-FMN oxidoreductase RutF